MARPHTRHPLRSNLIAAAAALCAAGLAAPASAQSEGGLYIAGYGFSFQDVADQFVTRTHTMQKFARGVAFFSVGLAKKVLLANPCGKIADLAFGAGSLGVVDAWYGVTAYAFQIYFDFSGYSDMAIGLGLMLGFVFPKNFDSPYLSKSITEFWRRWHISLSSWLRDYLFLKLGFVFSRRLDGVRWFGVRQDVWVYTAAAMLELAGWICPLTPLEQRWRTAAGEAGYSGGYIEHYLTAAIYPDGLTRDVQVALGLAVVAINAALYGAAWRRAARRRRAG